ncbi:ATP-dependent Clp protease proteolytic subunit, partial [Glutamicibacter creatinolyticus]|uniref:ATP-dependent Clp protease proteolytic subunit n=3 Tax=Micrococcaceae TaxID=1268 RepID=UPI003B981821
GKRLALPNARVLIHQPAMGGGERGTATDLQIQAEEVMRMREWLENTLSSHTGQDTEKVRNDIERDLFMTADEAKTYGIVDEVLTSRKLARQVGH